MSAVSRKKRKTVRDIRAAKHNTPLVCLTAYTAPVASVLDERVDLLLRADLEVELRLVDVDLGPQPHTTALQGPTSLVLRLFLLTSGTSTDSTDGQ